MSLDQINWASQYPWFARWEMKGNEYVCVTLSGKKFDDIIKLKSWVETQKGKTK